MVEAGTQDFRRCVLKNTNCNTKNNASTKCMKRVWDVRGQRCHSLSAKTCRRSKMGHYAEGEQVDSVRELETHQRLQKCHVFQVCFEDVFDFCYVS